MNENLIEFKQKEAPKSNRKVIYYVLFILIVAVGAGLWFWFSLSKSKTSQQDVNVSPTQQPQTQASEEENDPFLQIDTFGSINRDLESIGNLEDVNLEEVDKDLNSL